MELVVLSAMLILIVSVVFYALKYGICPTPSTKAAISEINSLVKKAPKGPLLELGAGFGSLSYSLSKNHPERKIQSFEISPLPWLVSSCALLGQKNISLKRKNFLEESFRECSVIVCYLYPGAMEKLRVKFESELNEGTIVISNTFAIRGWTPDSVVHLNDLYQTPIYYYHFRSTE